MCKGPEVGRIPGTGRSPVCLGQKSQRRRGGQSEPVLQTLQVMEV